MARPWAMAIVAVEEEAAEDMVIVLVAAILEARTSTRDSVKAM